MGFLCGPGQTFPTILPLLCAFNTRPCSCTAFGLRGTPAPAPLNCHNAGSGSVRVRCDRDIDLGSITTVLSLKNLMKSGRQSPKRARPAGREVGLARENACERVGPVLGRIKRLMISMNRQRGQLVFSPGPGCDISPHRPEHSRRTTFLSRWCLNRHERIGIPA